MSLATLKKKTQAKYNNLSVGTGFSLNGVHRNQGYIGQSTQSRTIIGTPMNGSAPRGHGGCCGKYNTNINKTALCLEKSTSVKQSVLSSKGMLRLRNKWLYRGGEHAPVKPDYNHNINIASMATELRRRKELELLAKGSKCEPVVGEVTSSCVCNNDTEIVQPEDSYIPMDQSEYIVRKTVKCTMNDPIQITVGEKRHPFRGFV